MNERGDWVHLVIPCFRESQRLPRFLPALCEALDPLPSVRVLVVDDGSGDEEQRGLCSLIDSLRPAHPFLCAPLLLPQNRGKGGAIYAGWNQADGAAWLGFVDADGSIEPSEVVRVIEMASREGPSRGALFGSRVLMLGRKVTRDFHRHLIGRVYATLVSNLLDIPVYDSQCGFKLVPEIAWNQIKPKLQVGGFAFDVELLVALLDSGVNVTEVPIDWHETPGGKVHLIHDSYRMYRDVLKVRKLRKINVDNLDKKVVQIRKD